VNVTSGGHLVVGDGQRLVTELHRRLDEVFRMRSSVEKGEVGVTVQLGIPAHPVHLVEQLFDRCNASVEESASVFHGLMHTHGLAP
jgi:hypothetical protein